MIGIGISAARQMYSAVVTSTTNYFMKLQGGKFLTLSGDVWVRISTPAPKLGSTFTLGQSNVY